MFSFCLLTLVGEICVSVSEPVDLVSREGFLDNDKREGRSFIQKSGV